MYNFDAYNVLLAIATNIPQRLQTGFVLQVHKWFGAQKKHFGNTLHLDCTIFNVSRQPFYPEIRLTNVLKKITIVF